MAASKYKEGQIIIGNGRIFNVLKCSVGSGSPCHRCSFSKIHNPHYDRLQSCDLRRRYYLGETDDCHSFLGEPKLLPKNCCFKDITKGV